MFAIVGLGNPGTEYEHTRHNAGFEVVDILADKLKVSYWKDSCGSQLAETAYTYGAQSEHAGQTEDIVLVKPQSFMNRSGGPVSHVCKEYCLKPENLIVVHDELDIPAGTVKVKQGGGHAGHNGLRSIIDKLGSKDFYRVRIGIGRPPGKMPVVRYVLEAPRKEAKDDFDEACYLGSQAALSLIEEGLAKTQSRFNG